MWQSQNIKALVTNELQGFTHATVLYRGKLYGYEASLFSVKLLPPAKIDAEAKRLAACVKSDCAGD